MMMPTVLLPLSRGSLAPTPRASRQPPPRPRRRDCRLAVLMACLAGLLGGSCRASRVGSAPRLRQAEQAPVVTPILAPARLLRVDVIAVGHGDAIFITSPGGKTVLIDGGPAEAGETVASFVSSRTREPLDLVMLTHRHADHLGGLAVVIARQGARAFMDGASPHPSPAYDRLMRLLDERHIPVRQAQQGRVVDLGDDTRLVLLAPPSPRIAGSRSDVNANSIVARLQFGRVRVLLTGDAEAITEDWLLDGKADLRADVLKLAHHGSQYSSTARFLAAVSPRIAIASCGSETQGGHLHPATVDRVEQTGAHLYDTHRDGNITVLADGRDVRILTQNDAVSPRTVVAR